MELTNLTVGLPNEDEPDQDEELVNTKSKWSIMESTHYQTHRSFIFSHSPSHQQWASVTKTHLITQSKSPAKHRETHYPQFMPSH